VATGWHKFLSFYESYHDARYGWVAGAARPASLPEGGVHIPPIAAQARVMPARSSGSRDGLVTIHHTLERAANAAALMALAIEEHAVCAAGMGLAGGVAPPAARTAYR
jgi:hypothetical protein